MLKIAQWKKILGHSEKQKVLVEVSGKAEVMTDTQSYRFEELTSTRDTEKVAADRNPLDDPQYKLQDAAFRLMITEDELLQKAAAGSIFLYVDTAGLQGHWRRRNAAGEIHQSELKVSKSGLLALDQKTCKELAATGTAQVSTLHFRPRSDLSMLNIDQETLATLIAWGGNRQFCLQDPMQIGREEVLLLPPLVLSV